MTTPSSPSGRTPTQRPRAWTPTVPARQGREVSPPRAERHGEFEMLPPPPRTSVRVNTPRRWRVHTRAAAREFIFRRPTPDQRVIASTTHEPFTHNPVIHGKIAFAFGRLETVLERDAQYWRVPQMAALLLMLRVLLSVQSNPRREQYFVRLAILREEVRKKYPSLVRLLP